MKISAVFTLLLALGFGFGKVCCNESENSTKLEPLGGSESTTTLDNLRSENQEAEQMATTQTTTTTYKIPPTLLNTKIDYQGKSDKKENKDKSEKHEKSLKDLG